MKDFIIAARKQGFEKVDIRSLLRKPYLVPESKNIDELFRELQETKVHIAILIDEYGGFSGIVTIEDLIEEVMGNIDDEYDDYEASLRSRRKHIFNRRPILYRRFERRTAPQSGVGGARNRRRACH
jgi:putative hemolysin